MAAEAEASVARELGVQTLRLTGGEPLVRPGVAELVHMVAEVGFEDVSLTTNGMLLARLADELAHAGLRSVNVSCDSLQCDRFGEITGCDALARVLAAMDAAEAAGLTPVRVNVVVMVGVNDDEVLDFADYARRTGRTVLRNVTGGRGWPPPRKVVRRAISRGPRPRR